MHSSSLFSGRSRSLVLLLAALLLSPPLRGQEATVTESLQTFRTYPFSDPDPVGRMGTIYPYFRFDGYSMTPVDRQWKIITLYSLRELPRHDLQ